MIEVLFGLVALACGFLAVLLLAAIYVSARSTIRIYYVAWALDLAGLAFIAWAQLEGLGEASHRLLAMVCIAALTWFLGWEQEPVDDEINEAKAELAASGSIDQQQNAATQTNSSQPVVDKSASVLAHQEFQPAP